MNGGWGRDLGGFSEIRKLYEAVEKRQAEHPFFKIEFEHDRSERRWRVTFNGCFWRRFCARFEAEAEVVALQNLINEYLTWEQEYA